MEKVYEELDKIKSENEKLRADYKSKAELCENLKKDRSEQLNKIHDANSKVEKQAQELIEKAAEISEVKRLFEDLKTSLIEKESIIKRISATNDKLRADCDEKYRKLEEENRKLVLALDEASEKSIDQEQKINVFKAEIEGLKGMLSASERKCLEAERKAKSPKELKERDGMLVKFEEEKSKVEDQLKWKKEQFRHLEEAHEKLKDLFRMSEKEWEKERSKLFDDISSLQTSLDSQTRISGDLQNRLQNCNQALAHEESRRKYLEVQVSEFKTHFENTFAEYQDAKSQLEGLAEKRDKEIAALRHSLSTKEAFYKEMEYRARKLETENQDLVTSLKELQEAQIDNAGSASSLAKLRNRLRNVEQMHRDCTANLRAKDAEWSSQMEKMDVELKDCRSELESKDAALEKLKKEQFRHLEAHEKLKDQFRVSEKEWEKERSKLFDEISSLQTSLDSQTRISEDLQNRLQNCNQALAHEESRRKYLEVQVTEFKTRFENTFAQYQDAKSQLEGLAEKRDKEIEALRHSLSTKEAFYKEIEYRARKLETENQDLLTSLKELQEAQIHNAGSASSLAKLRNRLRSVEQTHKDCTANLRAKEAEWSSQMEKIDAELNDCRSELESKDAALEKLKMELESYHSLTSQMKMQNEEISVMLLVLKAGVSEAASKLAHVDSETDLRNKEREEHVSLLMKQLEMKTAALAKAQTDIKEEREKTSSLLKRIESFVLIEEQGLLMQKELDRYKEILEESSRCQLHSKRQALQIETDLNEKLREACDALDTVKLELAGEREKAASLSRRVESLAHIEEQHLRMQKELERYKEMLEESSRCQLHLKDQALQMESDSKAKLKEFCDALNIANSELAEERKKAASLSRRVESLDHIEEHQLLMQKELERCNEMLEESSSCQLRLKEQASQMESDSKEKLKQLCDALDIANSELVEEREKAASLSRRVESLAHFEEQHLQMQKELERYKEMLEESSRCQLHLKERALQMESDSEEKLKEVSDALDIANSELVEEREKAASLSRRVESLDHIEEQHLVMQKELERYKEMLEESSRRQLCLQEQALQMESDSKSIFKEVYDALETANFELAEKTSEGHAIEFELWIWQSIAERLKGDLEESQKLRKEIEASLLAQVEVGQTIEHENVGLVCVLEEKDSRISSLHEQNGMLEEESFRRELESVVLTQIGAEQEKEYLYHLLEEKNHKIDDLLQLVLEVEAELEAKRLEMKKLTNQLEAKLRNSDALIDLLRSEREDLLGYMEELEDRISEDRQLMGILGNIVQSIDNNKSCEISRGDDHLFDSVKENAITLHSPTMKRFEGDLDERSPFRQLN